MRPEARVDWVQEAADTIYAARMLSKDEALKVIEATLWDAIRSGREEHEELDEVR